MTCGCNKPICQTTGVPNPFAIGALFATLVAVISNYLESFVNILHNNITKYLIKDYEPYIFTEQDYKNVIPSAENMEDVEGNNYLQALPNGSAIFSKQGLNHIELSDGKDRVFFSMCSTKTKDGMTSLVTNFNSYKDNVYLFCTKTVIDPGMLSLKHYSNYTVLIISGLKTEDVAISFSGDQTDLLKAVILNQKWSEYQDSIASKWSEYTFFDDLII
jgi:hypothetical protein